MKVESIWLNFFLEKIYLLLYTELNIDREVDFVYFDGILFDLDGTLLPMDNDRFTRDYLHLLANSVSHLGYKEETMVPAMWKGVSAMVKNDGSVSNYDVFWKVFSDIIGEKVYDDIPTFDEFYRTEFHKAKAFTEPTDLSKEIVLEAHKKADKVILATNPLFPRVAVDSRLSWVGLKSDDFDYITDYSNSSFCKPNTEYYLQIGKIMNLDLSKCLMVGNNTDEDAFASMEVGMSSYLVTDYLISGKTMPSCPKGSLKDLLTYLQNL